MTFIGRELIKLDKVVELGDFINYVNFTLTPSWLFS